METPKYGQIAIFCGLLAYCALCIPKCYNEYFPVLATPSLQGVPDTPNQSTALSARIDGPTRLAYDTKGFLYIVESMRGRLLRLDVEHGTIETIIPEPSDGINKYFAYPNAVVSDQHTNVYIADFNGQLRKLDTRSREVSTIFPTDTVTSRGQIEDPEGVTMDSHGDLLIVSNQKHKLFRWRRETGRLEIVVGGGRGFAGDGGEAIDAKLSFPSGVAVDNAGDILIADSVNCRIRRIDTKTQIITTFAGAGECSSTGDGGPAITATINNPSSIASDHTGNLFFLEGTRVRRIDDHGIITTYAGTGRKGFGGDGGPAENATFFNDLSGLAIDPDGNLYISEFLHGCIRRVDAHTHSITTIAGGGGPPGARDIPIH